MWCYWAFYLVIQSPEPEENFSPPSNDGCNNVYTIICNTLSGYGSGSSVGIATDYVLDGPGSNPRWDEIFRPSGPVLVPTHPPVKWVPGLSRG